MKTVWKWIAVECAMLLLIGILLHRGYTGMPDFLFEREDLLLETQQDNGSDTKAGYYADSSFEGTSFVIRTPEFSPGRGIYTVTVEYEARNCDDVHTQVTQTGSYYGQGALRGDSVSVDLQERSVTYHIYVLHKGSSARVQASFQTVPDGDSYFGISRIRVVSSPLSWILATTLAVGLVLLLGAVWLIWKKRPAWITGERRVTFFLLSCIVLLSSAPLLVNYPIQGHDLGFHLMRIEGIKAGLESGAFPVKIYPLWLGGNGYASGVLYPDLFLYIPVLFRFLGMPVYLAYQCYTFLVNLATVCITFRCFKRMFGTDKSGVLAALCFTLYPYRLTDIYIRAAVGEYTAMTFLPLVLCGVYEIYREADAEKKAGKTGAVMLAAGLTGVLQSHVLTFEITALFLLLAGLLLFQKTFSKRIFFRLLKTGAVTVLLNLWFLIPFLDYNEMSFVYNSPGRVEESSGIQQSGMFLYQFFTVNFQKSTSKAVSAGLQEEHLLGIGLGFLAVLFFWLLGLVRGRKEKWGRAEKLCLAFCVCSLFLSTCLFPYDALLGLLGKRALFLTSLQFPWRFLAAAGVFLTWLACILERDAGRDGGRERARFLLGAIGFCTVLQALFFLNTVMDESSAWRPYDTAALTTFAGAGYEYLPAGTVAQQVPREVETAKGQPVVTYSRRYNALTLDVENEDGKEAALDLPLLSYVGYEAEDENHTPIEMTWGRNNSIRLLIPAGYRGRIRVAFREPALWRIAELVSVYTLLCLAVDRISGRYFRWKKKRTEKGGKSDPLYIEETETKETENDVRKQDTDSF